MIKLAAALLLASVVVATACGSADRPIRTEAGAGDSTTSSLMDPPRAPERFSPPPTVDPTAVERNDNRQDGEVGSLCWAMWEVGRSFLEGVARDDYDMGVRRFDERAPGVLRHLREIQANLPPEIRPFNERFIVDLEKGRKYSSESVGSDAQQRWERLFGLFPFNDYPAVEPYAEAAKQDPDCETV